MRRFHTLTAFAFSFACAAQWDGAPTPVRIDTVLWCTGLGQATDIANCGDHRLFITLKQGVVRMVADSMVLLPDTFINVVGPVNDAAAEQGLLGITFHPLYDSTHWFYMHWTASPSPGITKVVRYSVGSDPNHWQPGTAHGVFTYPQPDTNHNGGDLDFGPDGMLYIPLGDGGGAGDPDDHAQKLNDPLGDILRLDVSGADTPYVIPADNPFVNAGPDTLKEIWASGLRNPWRFGFDRLTGDLWLGDVGQAAWEEVDFVPAGDPGGMNFGWRCREGFVPYNTVGCQPGSFYRPPVKVQPNTPWCSVIGGRVYRGAKYPRLFGTYVYTDYCLGEFHGLRPDGLGGWIDDTLLTTGITGFTCIGEDSAGTLYAANKNSGRLYQLRDRCTMAAPLIDQFGPDLVADAGAQWQWYLGDSLIAGADQQAFTPLVNGSYHVVARFDSTCALASAPHTFIASGVPPGFNGNDVPVLRATAVPGGVLATWRGDMPAATLEIRDVLGRSVERVSVTLSPRMLGTAQLVAAPYLLVLRDARDSLLGTAWFNVIR